MSSSAAVPAIPMARRWSLPHFLLYGQFGNQFLRDAHGVHHRQTQIISDAPNPRARRDVRVRLDARQMNVAFTGDSDVGRRGIFRRVDLHPEIAESRLELLAGLRRGKFRVGGESV